MVSGNGTLSFADDWLSSDRKEHHGHLHSDRRDPVCFETHGDFQRGRRDDGRQPIRRAKFYVLSGTGQRSHAQHSQRERRHRHARRRGIFRTGRFCRRRRESSDPDQIPRSGHHRAIAVGVQRACVGRDGRRRQIGDERVPARDGAALFTKIKQLDVNPFSSFYDIFLPAGVSHFFPQGKEAQLCLMYDSGVSDPASLNIYYYNQNTDEYLLEGQDKTVDTDNQRICVNIAHASVFTVLGSSASVITGGGYTGELGVLNFPNPFNLKSKTVTLQNRDTAGSASQTINGTMIKISLPPSMNGNIEIKIYDVVGEQVRTLDDSGRDRRRVLLFRVGRQKRSRSKRGVGHVHRAFHHRRRQRKVLQDGGAQVSRALFDFLLRSAFCVPSLAASRPTKNAGTSGAQFLKIGAGARPTAMGDSFAGVADDVNAVYYNPAGLGFLDKTEFTAMHTQYFQGLDYDFGAFVRPLQSGALGLSAATLKTDAFTRRALDETNTGSFTDQDAAYAFVVRPTAWTTGFPLA